MILESRTGITKGVQTRDPVNFETRDRKTVVLARRKQTEAKVLSLQGSINQLGVVDAVDRAPVAETAALEVSDSFGGAEAGGVVGETGSWVCCG